jgi:hypothetical protein
MWPFGLSSENHMATAATIASSAAIIKELYPFGDVPWTILKNHHMFEWLEKNEDFVGDPVRVAVQTETTQGASATFLNAQNNMQPSAYFAFYVHRVTDYSLARIDNHALAAADGNEGSLVALWEREIDSAMKTAMLATDIQCFRSGTGSRGQLASWTTNLATLNVVTDATNFGVGMSVGGSANDGGALRVASGTCEIIAGVDYVNGVLQSTSVNWNTILSALGQTDFLVRDGDGANGGTSLVLTGMAGWIPGGTLASPPSSLFNCTRSSNPVGLAGQTYNATTVSLEEAVIEGVARVMTQGGSPDTIVMHPRKKGNLLKSLESKTMYTKTKGTTDGAVGFDRVFFESDAGPIEILSDTNCPYNTAWLLQKNSWELGSIGKCPRIQDFDTLNYLRVYNADQLEVRIYSYYQLVCMAPRWQMQIQNFGN